MMADLASMLDWALYYAEALGWAVIPLHSMRGDCCSCGSYACPSPAKHPRTRRGVSEATTDLEQIRAWWTQWPDANIGIATGPTSGIMVIDVDPRHYGDDNYYDLLSEAGLDAIPPSLQVLTGGGGWHDYLRIPADADVRNAASVRGHEGVDVRGRGGYVVAPPSIHHSGRGYCWELASDPTDGATLADCPPALLRLLSGQQPRLRSVKSTDGQTRPARAAGEKIHQGGRNNDLIRYLGGLRALGAELDELVRRGLEYTDRYHDPPLTDGEVYRTAQSAARYPPHPQLPPPLPPHLDDDAPPHTDQDAPPWIHAPRVTQSPEDQQGQSDVRPEIIVGRPKQVLDDEARSALVSYCQVLSGQQSLQEYPRPLWLRGGQIVTIAPGDAPGVLEIAPGVAEHVHDALAHAARWVKLRGRGDDIQIIPTDPTMDLAKSILTSPPLALPHLTGLASAPIFGEDGAYLSKLGYHRRDGIWRYGIQDLPVVTSPSAAEVREARDKILYLVQDFEFVGEADLAALMAYWFVPHIRRMIHGAVPMTIFTAPKNGVGKSLLAELGQLLYLGREAGTQALSRRDEELRKTLTAAALDGSAYLYFDNIPVTADFSSPTLSAALTSTVWQDRILGSTKRASIPVTWIPVATTAGEDVLDEMSRRVVVCQITTHLEKPWKRTDFKIRDLKSHVLKHRRELLGAMHTCIGAWVSAGAPRADITLGSYVDFARVVGGLLEFLDIPGFLNNLDTFYAASDAEAQRWDVIMGIWVDAFGETAITVSDLLDEIRERGMLDEVDLGRYPQRTLRRYLAAQVGGVIGGHKVTIAGRTRRPGSPTAFVAKKVRVGVHRQS